ncbi:hypothetical protein B0T22DRAFT_521278 [Podospora appendiculata]|uniref:Protein kinase domain-containing protein n=1 Tax=Podospora appendiculata TaxID=314037 RepID=A0AAE1C7Y2_9PEZI|nr:hypothetical protein B0T22DRAFT_521278 [Podospora appendiculata]
MADVPDNPTRPTLPHLRQMLTDAQKYFRRGKFREWDPGANGNPTGQIHSARLRDLVATGMAPAAIARQPLLPPIRRVGADLAANQVPTPGQEQIAEQRLIRQLQPHGLNFVRTLGFGGHGLVALFDMRDGNQTPTYYVAKTNFVNAYLTPQRRQEIIARLGMERAAMVELMRAAHIVQVVTDPTVQGANFRAVMGGGANPASAEYQRAIARAVLVAQGEPNVILMEYCARGVFGRVLQQMGLKIEILHRRSPGLPPYRLPAGFQTNFIPDRILWHIFDCLVKACIAMEYPPRTRHATQWAASGGDHGLPFSETLPNRVGGNERPGSEIVHFDIDSANVFVGDFNDPVVADAAGGRDLHDQVPIMKIGDFGTSYHITAVRRMVDMRFMWSRRHMFKPDYGTPEQFTEEWDYIATTPHIYTLATNNPVQVAAVMYEAISLTKLPTQPLPTAIKLARLHPRRPITYGAHLLHTSLKPVSRRLRKLVMECMLERPDDRPTLREVRAVIRSELRQPVAPSQALAHQQWWEAAVGEPRPVGNKMQAGAPYVRDINKLDDWINHNFDPGRIPVLRPRYR